MADFYLRNLKPDTLEGLRVVSSDFGWPDLYFYAQPEQIAWLSFKLKAVEDRAEYFPHGKWATIQRLQTLLDEAQDVAFELAESKRESNQ
jgi:hypothetical protein